MIRSHDKFLFISQVAERFGWLCQRFQAGLAPWPLEPAQRADPSFSPGRLRRFLEWAALAALTLCMTWPGFHQGLGYIPEEVRRVAIAVQIAHSGDLNPHWFGHPASLLIYTLSAIYKSLSLASVWWGALGGAWSDLRAIYLSEPAGLFLIGRGVARLAAVAAVIATLEVGGRIMARPWAMTAAALTALNPVFITHSNRLRSDHMLTFLLLLGALFISQSLTSSRPQRSQAISGAWAGVAITFKYLAGCLLLAQVLVLASAVQRPWKERVRSMVVVILVACLSSFLASPFLWLDLPTALRDVFWEATKKEYQWNPLLSFEKIFVITRYGFGDLGTVLLLVVAVCGLLTLLAGGLTGMRLAIRRAGENPYSALVLVSVTYFASTFLATRWKGPWMAPMVPFLALFLIKESLRWSSFLATRRALFGGGKVVGTALMALLVVVVVSAQLPADASIRSIRTSPTVMSRAEAWIEAHVTSGSRILLWQPHADQDGFFPRVRARDVTLLRVNDVGSVEKVCAGDVVTHYVTSQVLPKVKCFPRPRVKSQTADGVLPSLDGMDLLITSSRNPPNHPLITRVGTILEPVAVFSKPVYKQRLSYPTDEGFPEGDYGMWRHIRIYSLPARTGSASPG